MIPPGTKDREINQKSKQVTFSFIDELHEKEHLKMHVTIEEDILTEMIFTRLNSTNTSLMKLEDLIVSKDLEKLKKHVFELGLADVDIMNMYQSLFIVGILGAYELFKKYLLMTLNKNSLNITGRESLGQLLYKLKNKNIIYGFDEFLDKDLRNALSHDWYWFSKNIFYYTIDPDLKRTKSLSLGELMI